MTTTKRKEKPMLSTTVETGPFTVEELFAVPQNPCFLTSDCINPKAVHLPVTFEYGPMFQRFCWGIVESEVEPSEAQVVSFDRAILLNDAIGLIGQRWKAVNLWAVYYLAAQRRESRLALQKAKYTYFRIEHQAFSGLVFITPLGDHQWFIDAIPDGKESEVSWLERGCKFVYPVIKPE